MLKLFGLKPRENYQAEIARLLADLEKMAKVFDVPHESPEQRQELLERRIATVNDASVHPVARLASSELFHDMVFDYLEKLREASQGSREAMAAVAEIKKKMPSVLKEEEERLKEKREHLEDTFAETIKWQERKQQASEDRDIALHRLDMLRPKDEKDVNQWRAYYQGRVKILENDAIDVGARMLWTNKEGRDELVEQYYDLLDKLIMDEDVEKEFHVLEAKLKAMVAAEAREIRARHPQFFGSESSV